VLFYPINEDNDDYDQPVQSGGKAKKDEDEEREVEWRETKRSG